MDKSEVSCFLTHRVDAACIAPCCLLLLRSPLHCSMPRYQKMRRAPLFTLDVFRCYGAWCRPDAVGVVLGAAAAHSPRPFVPEVPCSSPSGCRLQGTVSRVYGCLSSSAANFWRAVKSTTKICAQIIFSTAHKFDCVNVISTITHLIAICDYALPKYLQLILVNKDYHKQSGPH